MLLQVSNVIFDFLIFDMDSTICALQVPEILKSSIKSSADSAVVWARVVWWALTCHNFSEIRMKTLKPVGNSHSVMFQEFDVFFDFYAFHMNSTICALQVP